MSVSLRLGSAKLPIAKPFQWTGRVLVDCRKQFGHSPKLTSGCTFDVYDPQDILKSFANQNGRTLSLQQLQKKREALCASASARAWGDALQGQLGLGHCSRACRLWARGTAGRKQAQCQIRRPKLLVLHHDSNSIFTLTTVDHSALSLSDPIALPLMARTEAELLGHSPRSTRELKSVHVPCS